MTEPTQYIRASSLLQISIENPHVIGPEHQQLLGRYLNLPHATTQAILWQTCPQLQIVEYRLTNEAPANLIEQWTLHRQKLTDTWKRLQSLSYDIHITNPRSPANAYLSAAGLGPRWWQRSTSHLRSALLHLEEVYICLYDLLCIFSCNEHGTQYWNSFGMPCTESLAIDYAIHISCPDFTT